MAERLVGLLAGGRRAVALQQPDRRRTRGQAASGNSGAGRGGHVRRQHSGTWRRRKKAAPTLRTPVVTAVRLAAM